MGISNLRRRLVIFIGVAGLAAPRWAAAQRRGGVNRAGVVNFVTGDATLWDAESQFVLANGTVVKQGSTVETGPDSEVHIVFDDGGLLAVRQSSRIQIDQAHIAGGFSDSLTLTLLRGAMRSITGWVGKFDKNSYQLRAATATIGIRGTDHEVAIIPAGEERSGEIAGIHSWVREGGTTLTNPGGHIDVDTGHAAWAAHDGKAPQLHEGIPAFLQRRKTQNEVRIDRHAKHITEHIEKRMLKRGMIKPGESLGDAQLRHAALQSKSVSQKQDKASESEADTHEHKETRKQKNSHRRK